MPLKGRLKYGLWWGEQYNDLEIERRMIRLGGRHINPKVKKFVGKPLLEHYKAMMLLLWPDEEIDPWTELALKSFLEHKITVLMGPKDCAKTQSMAKFVLCDWWCFPDETLWLISSTTLKGAELRVYGRIKGLFNRAKENWPDLEGRPLESLGCITNQRVEASASARNRDLARILDRGIVVVPCRQGGDFVALSTYIGVKAPRLRHCGDEVSIMGDGFLNVYNNFVGEEKDFKGLMAGNPTDLLDPLCRAAKPPAGWDAFIDTKLTQEWDSSFHRAHVICFDGRDSPNNAFPGPVARYKHLITARDVANIVRTNGDDHPMTYMQAYGKPNRILAHKRVITETLCKQHHAMDEVIWASGGRTMIYGLDPAYGGADPCVGLPGEFGMDVDRNLVLKIYPAEIIPIRASVATEPDDQIAEWIQQRLLQLNIPGTSCFYGAFGKGTLGNAFSRVFAQGQCPIGIDEGGSPTKRPVRDDLYTIDEQTKARRLMRCDEYYDRKISELWYSARLCIESDQMRDLPSDVMDEGCIRIYTMVRGHKVSVETKEELKKRMQGQSPNKFDALTFVVEGARQKGFSIARLGKDIAPDFALDQWKRDLKERAEELRTSKELTYA